MSNQNNISGKNRLFYFDLLRTIACLGVIMIHVCASSVTKEIGGLDYWAGIFLNALSRACVPLFVMLSGALLLDENYIFTREKWLGRILKMLLFFMFWAAGYTLVFDVAGALVKHEEVHVLDAILSMLKGFYHLWFIPMIIGLYLLIPLLRLWVKKQNRQYIEYFLILSLFFSSLIPQLVRILVCFNPAFETLGEAFDNINMHYTLGYTSYFILGWYLHNFDLRRKKLFYVLGFAGFCITVTGTYLLYKLTGISEFVFTGNFAVNVLFYSIAIFIFAKANFAHRQQLPSAFSGLVSCVSKHSLGIYAVHAAVIAVAMRIFAGMHVLIMLPCTFAISAVISLLASIIISKIPFFKRFV